MTETLMLWNIGVYYITLKFITMTDELYEKAERLRAKYILAKDEIERYIGDYHDEMYFDIMGYQEYLYDRELTESNIERLEARVNACIILEKGLRLFNDETKTTYC